MIRILDKNVADKIAAGEVVERPLSVVKELVENSIDAMPGFITVEIKNGGKTYIRVTDNGNGIPEEDVEKAFSRHATSKLQEISDLDTIHTLGFRGEALASIAAVSRTELVTKTRDCDYGRRVIVEGSEILSNKAVGTEDGTTIVVKDLFFNTPARKKFLKSDAAESTAIIDFLARMAMAYINIKFRVINNGVMLFSTRGTCDRRENILTVFGRKVGENLIPVNEGCSFMEMEGYFSDPGESRSNRKQQIFFVNGRVIESKTISKAVADAYSDRLFKGRHPIAYIFISIDPGEIDVNIHPNKKEIKFHDSEKVKRFITESIKASLKTEDAVPEIRKINIKDVLASEKKDAEGEALDSTSENSSFSESDSINDADEHLSDFGQLDMKSVLNDIKRQVQESRADTDYDKTGFEKNKSDQNKTDKYSSDETKDTLILREESKNKYFSKQLTKEKNREPFEIDELNVKGVIFGSYIMAEKGDSFYLIDQHAAHERIFFEKLVTRFDNDQKVIQPLLTPFSIDVSFSMLESAESWMKILTDMGFDIEEFGPRTYKVCGIPGFMTITEAENFLDDYLENCSGKKEFKNNTVLEKIILKSCKSAIKANDYISMDEIKVLLKDLSKCKNPFSCPHGRPVFVRLTRYEIEKMFKRC